MPATYHVNCAFAWVTVLLAINRILTGGNSGRKSNPQSEAGTDLRGQRGLLYIM
jgi:hypothetical protein